jgi:micrococcal nuclease
VKSQEEESATPSSQPEEEDQEQSASEASSKSGEEDSAQSSFEATTTVIRIVDGDTVDIRPAVEGNTRVRLIGVDTPETRDPDCGKQPYSDQATAFTTSRLQGQEVGLEFDVERTDRYKRLLAYVYPDEVEMFNETLLREVYAQVATFPPNVRYVDRFLAAQEEARAIGAGIWSLSPEELATQTDRGNGIGGGCNQKAQQEAPPEPLVAPPPEPPSVPKVAPNQAPALPKGDVDCGDFTTQA